MLLDEKQASRLSREDALRVLASADDVSPRERRMAVLMLAGPTIDRAPARPRRKGMAVAVNAALAQYRADAAADLAQAQHDLRELAGGRI
jgi:hypothetical protein